MVGNAVLVLKSLVQSQLSAPVPNASSSSKAPIKIIERLAYNVDEVRHPSARACILWLVGQYAGMESPSHAVLGIEGIADWAPDTLRRIAKTFTKEVGYYPQTTLVSN